MPTFDLSLTTQYQNVKIENPNFTKKNRKLDWESRKKTISISK